MATLSRPGFPRLKEPHVSINVARLHKSAGNTMEVAFAKAWEKENTTPLRSSPLLEHLVGGYTDRDAQVAASVVQWLGSQVGRRFLVDAIASCPELKSFVAGEIGGCVEKKRK